MLAKVASTCRIEHVSVLSLSELSVVLLSSSCCPHPESSSPAGWRGRRESEEGQRVVRGRGGTYRQKADGVDGQLVNLAVTHGCGVCSDSSSLVGDLGKVQEEKIENGGWRMEDGGIRMEKMMEGFGGGSKSFEEGCSGQERVFSRSADGGGRYRARERRRSYWQQPPTSSHAPTHQSATCKHPLLATGTSSTRAGGAL